ncbi:MAG: prepilin-type N-terminal cleavage/methylation domain-containing protein [Chthoniobacterales bacterium]
MKTPDMSSTTRAFTLIELLVVISIIAVLAGLAFPAYQSVQNAARKTQAKNDLVQIVTAVNAFYTDYGKYPLPNGTQGEEYTYGTGGISSKALFDTLRGLPAAAATNPREIEFIKPPDAKDTRAPKGGMGEPADGQFYDPWGKPYVVTIDSDYNNVVTNPYTSNAGATPLRQGVISLSFGKDMETDGGNRNGGKSKDDIISWQ